MSHTKYCKHCGTKLPEVQKKGASRKFCNPECRQACYKNIDPHKAIFSSLKHRSARKNLAFALTEDWLKLRLNHGYCEVTGLKLVFKEYRAGDRGKQGFFAPSVDRIDNSVGYIPNFAQPAC